MGSKHVQFSEQIRRAVLACGMSRYAICKAIGMQQSSMSRFVRGTGGLQQDKLDALAKLLDINITVGKPKTTKKAR